MNHQPNTSESRRQFLQAAAGTAALAAMAGVAHAKGKLIHFGGAEQPGKAMARVPLKDGETIRMGVIGVGGMGQGHCAAFPKLSKERGCNVQVVAIADPWPRNLDKAHKMLTEGETNSKGEKNGPWQPEVEVTKYADYKDLLARKDIHAVLIASPEHWHHQHAIDAILAGKDVYCEKPMTLHLTDAVKLHKTATANPDIIVQVGTQKMALPSYKQAQKWIAEGLIGTPTCSQTSYCRNNKNGEWKYYFVDPKWEAGKDVDWEAWCGPLGETKFDPYLLNRWRRYKKASTGIIGDLLVHVMTPMMMALNQGWPVKVSALGGHLIDKEMENHDTLNILAEFETGHQMIVMGATTNDTGLTPTIRGNKGIIEINDGSVSFSPQREYSEDTEPMKPSLENIGDDQDKHRENWVKCIRSREKPNSNTEFGLKVMVVVDLATRSMWEGGQWVFDPATLTAKRT